MHFCIKRKNRELFSLVYVSLNIVLAISCILSDEGFSSKACEALMKSFKRTIKENLAKCKFKKFCSRFSKCNSFYPFIFIHKK